MSVEYVSEFEKGRPKEPVKLTFNNQQIDVHFADGEFNTFGYFQNDGTLHLYALEDGFADRLEASGFTLQTVKGERFLKVVK